MKIRDLISFFKAPHKGAQVSASQDGFSLTEMIVVVALFALSALFAALFTSTANKTLMDIRKSNDTLSEVYMMTSYMQKFVTGGDVRFYFFNGRNSATDTLAISRFLVPQPRRCVGSLGLDPENCPNGGSFYYIHYDKTAAPAATVICKYSTSAEDQYILVDANNNTYGNVAYNSSLPGFDVTAAGGTSYAQGPINLTVGNLVSLLDVPSATLWRVTEAPIDAGLSQASFNPDPPALEPPTPVMLGASPLQNDCAGLLQQDPMGPPGKKLISNVFRLKVEPFVGSQFTGGSTLNISADARLSRMGKLPLRIFSATIRAAGLDARSGTQDFVIANCNLNSTGSIVCSSSNILFRIARVKSLNIYEKFYVKLFNETTHLEAVDTLGTSPAKVFQIVKTAAEAPEASCGLGCAPLLVPNSTDIPGLYNASETFESLFVNSFSLFKQDSVSTIQFNLNFDNGKTEKVVIQFR